MRRLQSDQAKAIKIIQQMKETTRVPLKNNDDQEQPLTTRIAQLEEMLLSLLKNSFPESDPDSPGGSDEPYEHMTTRELISRMRKYDIRVTSSEVITIRRRFGDTKGRLTSADFEDMVRAMGLEITNPKIGKSFEKRNRKSSKRNKKSKKRHNKSPKCSRRSQQTDYCVRLGI